MSSGVGDSEALADLRALAHPVRLRMLSLLTGAPMSAAEVARELSLTHANASYHLRMLLAADLVVVAGEETIRGGRARRYRYNLAHPGSSSPDVTSSALYYQAVAGELVRRATSRRAVGKSGSSSDAELWVGRDDWEDAVEKVSATMVALHRAAVAPRSQGTIHVSVITALFEMGEGDQE